MTVWLADYSTCDDYHLYGVFSKRSNAVSAIGFDPDTRYKSRETLPGPNERNYQITKIVIDKVMKARL